MATLVKDTVRFLREYANTPTKIGAVAPSSRALAEVMCRALDVEHAETVVEFGPGTGALTDVVLQRLRPGARFITIEHNPNFVEILHERRPDLKLYHDTAENVKAICEREGVGSVDCILSGLPFASFSEELQRSLMDATLSVLRPGGRFATFAYWSGLCLPAGQRFRALIDEYFSHVDRTRTVWGNIPPAFVYCCEKSKSTSTSNGK